MTVSDSWAPLNKKMTTDRGEVPAIRSFIRMALQNISKHMLRDEKCLQNSYDLDVETYVQPNCRITRSCDLECTLWSDLDTNGSRGLAVPRICKLCSTGRDERRESKANAKTAVHAKTVRSTKTLRRKTSSLTQAANFSVLAA